MRITDEQLTELEAHLATPILKDLCADLREVREEIERLAQDNMRRCLVPRVRLPLYNFCMAMEEKLSTHDEDRGPLGWRNGWSPEGAFVRLCQETVELKSFLLRVGLSTEMDDQDEDGDFIPESPLEAGFRLESLMSEAVDVANFAMMIYDLAEIQVAGLSAADLEE